MNWTDIFPILSDDLLAEYRAGSRPGEQNQLEEWLDVAEIHPSQSPAHAGKAAVRASCVDGSSGPGDAVAGKMKSRAKHRRHLVSATLFWKHVMGTDPDLPKPTRERMVMAKRLGLVKRFSPWSSYVEPLLFHTPGAVERHPEVEFRLYLASDLDFLIPDLTSIGWEVHLMKSPSIRYCPGGFWRFLALGEKGRMVTMIDTDRMSEVDGEIARTRMMEEMGLGMWRVPGYHNVDNDGKAEEVRYRPILGGHFGAKGGLAIRELLEAFIWHARRGSLPVMANMPGRGQVPVHRVEWPSYGFDEFFQLAALYPRLVKGGTLSFIPNNAASVLLPVDIEYVTWANRRSEIVHF